MTKQRRSFSVEFKREAADLVLNQNYSYIEASRSLGIGESALRRWVDQVFLREHRHERLRAHAVVRLRVLGRVVRMHVTRAALVLGHVFLRGQRQKLPRRPMLARSPCNSLVKLLVGNREGTLQLKST